jgi:hypothetical protein
LPVKILLNRVEYLRNIALQQRELHLRRSAARVQHNIDGSLQQAKMLANGFPEAAFDPVTPNRFTHGAAHGEPNTRTGGRLTCYFSSGGRLRLAEQEEIAHLLSKPLAAGLIHPLVVRVPLQSICGSDHWTRGPYLAGVRPAQTLVAVTRADRDFVAALGAAAAEYSCAGLRLHARKEPMGLGAMAAVRLKGTLGHVSGSCSIFSLSQQFLSIPE